MEVDKKATIIFQRLKQILFSESVLFFLVVLIHLLPLFIFRFIPTVDGPAHVYNANLNRELLLNSNSPIHQFFVYNPEPLNWLHHIILIPLQFVFPAFLAEKILMGIYIIGLPYAFRKIVLSLNPGEKAGTYLIFPLVYSLLFLTGFYNFSLSIILLILIILYHEKTSGSFSFLKLFLLFLLLTILYLSHIFVFAVCFLALAINVLWKFIYSIEFKKDRLGQLLKQSAILFTAASYGIYKSASFFLGSQELSSSTELYKLSFRQLLEQLFHARPVIVYDYNAESVITRWLSLISVLLIIIVIIDRARDVMKNGYRNVFKITDHYLVTVILLLLIYFSIPDYIEGIGGHMSVRTATMLTLFFLIWIAVQNINKRILALGSISIVLISCLLLFRYIKVIGPLNKDAVEIERTADHIEPYSVVLPLGKSSNWIQTHFNNYLGINKQLIILDNYEARSENFPLLWNKTEMPAFHSGDPELDSCITVRTNGIGKPRVVDYIFAWKTDKNDSCILKVDRSEIYLPIETGDKKFGLYKYVGN